MATCLGKSVHSVYCSSFPFGFEGGICDLVVLIPDHCLSIYFPLV